MTERRVPEPVIVDQKRVLTILQQTHPDAVAAATWQAAYEDLVKQQHDARPEPETKPEPTPEPERGSDTTPPSH